MNTSKSKSSPRLQLAVIVLLAAGSLAGAYALFESARGGGLWATTNQGAFVEPPLTARELDVRSADGRPLESGVWWLWIVPDGPCAAQCRRALHQLRQLHVLLNRDAGRVRRALLAGGPEASDIAATYPRLALLSGNLERLEPGVYVVDPIGNLVLRYALSDAGKPVLDDLKRLLKVSQIG
jgi:hypothetical protein